MSHETDLRTAIAYLADLDAELEERRAHRAPGAHSDMLYQLDHARQLVAALEQRAANMSCMSCPSGCKMLIDLQKARRWCRAVEAEIAHICSDAGAAAAA